MLTHLRFLSTAAQYRDGFGEVGVDPLVYDATRVLPEKSEKRKRGEITWKPRQRVKQLLLELIPSTSGTDEQLQTFNLLSEEEDLEIIMPSDDDQSATPPGQSIYSPEQSIFSSEPCTSTQQSISPSEPSFSTPEASVTVQEHETAFDDDPNEDRQNREYTNVSKQPFKAGQPTSKTFSSIATPKGLTWMPPKSAQKKFTKQATKQQKELFHDLAKEAAMLRGKADYLQTVASEIVNFGDLLAEPKDRYNYGRTMSDIARKVFDNDFKDAPKVFDTKN